jgi:hypothetical protein
LLDLRSCIPDGNWVRATVRALGLDVPCVMMAAGVRPEQYLGQVHRLVERLPRRRLRRVGDR